MEVTAIDIKKALAQKHNKDFFMAEVKSGSTWNAPKGNLMILDALAIRKSWSSPCFTGYEVKVSRSDFLRDAKFYTYEVLVNCLYIVCPKGMIDRTELPESVGLMYYDPEKKTITTKKKAIYRKIEYSADMLLYIIYSRLDSDRIPFYSSRAEYFRDYVAGKIDSRELGYAARSKLVDDNAKLQKELESVNRFKEQRDAFLEIQRVAHQHGIWGGYHDKGLAEGIDRALKRKAVTDIVEIRNDLERILFKLQQMEIKEDDAEWNQILT